MTDRRKDELAAVLDVFGPLLGELRALLDRLDEVLAERENRSSA